MKRTITQIRHFNLRQATKNVLLIVAIMSIFDVSVTALGASYLSGNIGAFFGKSSMVILSDLLFLEGAIVFTIGIFIAAARAMQETRKMPNQSEEETNNTEMPYEKSLHFSTQMIIIGAILIGLSITVGTLLL